MGLSWVCLWRTYSQAQLWITAALLALLSDYLRLCKQLTTLLLIKPPLRRVALSRHRHQWALRAAVGLLACQTQTEAAVMNVATPPPANKTQTRRSFCRRPTPSSPWHINCIRWYAHLFVLLLGYGLTRPDLSNGDPHPPPPQSGMPLHPSMYVRPDGPPSSTQHSRNTAARMVVLSNNINPNPRLTAPDMAHNDPFHYARRRLLFGNDVETNLSLGPSHIRFPSLNVGGPHRSQTRWGKPYEDITVSEPVIISLQEVLTF